MLVMVLFAILALAGCKVDELAPDNSGGAGGGIEAINARSQLDELTVHAALPMSGYSRDRFPHWISQGDGCDTRDVVLKRQGKAVATTADCQITSGTWYSPYDGKSYTDPQDLDVDHVVPLAAAWRSGASQWTDDKREQFANDLTRPQLIAVSASVNRSKGDQDPSTWMPPLRSYWCVYAENWIAVKSFWKMTVTASEKAALGDMLDTCPIS
jgi:hypothetical protein